MQKAYWHKILICELIFFFAAAALFKTYGMWKDDIYGDVSDKCDFDAVSERLRMTVVSKNPTACTNFYYCSIFIPMRIMCYAMGKSAFYIP